MGKIKYRSQNDGLEREASDQAIAWAECGPSMTVTSQAEDADLNVLMRRYGITGKMPVNQKVPMYGDFTHITDYRSALEAVAQANEAFAQYPADIRSQFENNPQLMLEFFENPANRDAAIAMGFIDPPEPTIAPPVATPVAGTAPEAPKAA